MSARPSLAALIPPVGDGVPRASPGDDLFGERPTPRPGRGPAEGGPARPTAAALSAETLARFAQEPCPPEEAARDRTAEAVAAARAEAEREAEERHARAIADLESRSRERLEAARARWSEEEGERLANGLRHGLEAVREQACEATARVLAPLLEDAAREAAVAALAEAIRESARRPDAPWIEVTGPPDLVEAVSAALGDPHPSVSLVPSPDEAEVRAVAGFTVFETALSAWRETVAEILARAPARDGVAARAPVPEAAPELPDPGSRGASGEVEEAGDG